MGCVRARGRGGEGGGGECGRGGAARTSAGMEAWLMKHGSETREEVEPKETVTLKSFRCSENALDSATLPVSNDTRLPPPRAWLMCSLCPGSLGRPG